MSATASIWQRVGDLFRSHPPRTRFGLAEISDHNGHNGHAERPAIDDEQGSPAPPAPQRPSMFPLRWRSGAGRNAQERIVELMDAMQVHFDQHDRRAEALGHSVDRVAEILERLAETQRAQGEYISSIAAQVNASGEHVSRLSATLVEVPASLQAQAAAVRTMAQQMESSQQANIRLAGTLERFGAAAESLSQAGAVQVRTLERLHASDQEQKESLRAFIREQNRRFLAVAIIGAALGIAALVGLTIALVTVLGR